LCKRAQCCAKVKEVDQKCTNLSSCVQSSATVRWIGLMCAMLHKSMPSCIKVYKVQPKCAKSWEIIKKCTESWESVS
jgi:hypothetical protein